jgi:hypothetical protein
LLPRIANLARDGKKFQPEVICLGRMALADKATVPHQKAALRGSRLQMRYTRHEWCGTGQGSFSLSIGLVPHLINRKGCNNPVDGDCFEAVGGIADNFNGFSASTACLLAFNNPARRPEWGVQG